MLGFSRDNIQKSGLGILAIFIVFIVIHILLFNINAAEWGDSYRILRASEFIRHLSYPQDEKRLPLFSALLATWPNNIDPVVWGRVLMFCISLSAFMIFRNLYDRVSPVKKTGAVVIGLVFLVLNPVFLYWSIRIMADVPFAAIAIIGFYVSSRQGNSPIRNILIGVIAGLASLTRFEGFLLFASLGVGIVYNSGVDSFREFFPREVLKRVKENVGSLVLYIVSFSATLLPYLIYRNPLKSSYLGEPAGREYNLNTLLIYTASLLFLFGFTSGFYFYLKRKDVWNAFFLKNVGILVFVVLELVLILIWPAAIPRLFVSVIPLLLIPLADSVYLYFTDSDKGFPARNWVILLVLFALFAMSQYFLRLQFLVPVRKMFVVVALVQFAIIYSIYKRKLKLFVAATSFSMLIWALTTTWLHKDVFKVVKESAVFARDNLSGRVAYNDVSAVSPWYLGDRGIYLNLSDKENLQYNNLLDDGVDYLIISNEHNTGLDIDVNKRSSFLETLKEFKNTVGGQEFFAKIVRVKK